MRICDLLLPILVGLIAGTPGGRAAEYLEPRRVAILEDRRIDESSGLAASRRHEGIFYTHNDSGDKPRLFTFNRAGKNRGVVTVAGAKAVDWEDMASFADREGEACLLIADVGDNNARRRNCQLYIIREPDLGDHQVGVVQQIRFRYEGGPQNCEAVAVDSATQTVYLAGKRFAVTCPLFALRIPPPTSRGDQVARLVGRLSIPVATAMDISADGTRAVVLTYGHAYEFRRESQESWTEAFGRAATEIQMPARRQGESICYTTGGAAILLTSEHTPTPIWEIRRAPPQARRASE